MHVLASFLLVILKETQQLGGAHIPCQNLDLVAAFLKTLIWILSWKNLGSSFLMWIN